MSYYRRGHKPSVFEMQAMIALGGQISSSNKRNQLFQELCRLSPDFADIYVILNTIKDMEKIEDDDEAILLLIERLGMSENASMWTELTRLSAILGSKEERSVVTREPKVKPNG